MEHSSPDNLGGNHTNQQYNPYQNPQFLNGSKPPKKPFYKKVWFWVLIGVTVLVLIPISFVLLLLGIAAAGSSHNETASSVATTSLSPVTPSQTIESSLPTAEPTEEETTEPTAEISETPVQAIVPPTDSATTVTPEPSEAPTTTAAEDSSGVSAEYKSALGKANDYIDFMDFSSAGLYKQLTSEYGEKFSPEAAQYAVDNVKVDWNAEALGSAENYLDTMAFSYNGLYDQLTSEYGEQYTPEQAEYTIANL